MKRGLTTMLGDSDAASLAVADASMFLTPTHPRAAGEKKRTLPVLPILDECGPMECAARDGAGPDPTPFVEMMSPAAKRCRTAPALPDVRPPEIKIDPPVFNPSAAADDDSSPVSSPSSPSSVCLVSPKTGRWTKHEDELLREAVAEYGPKNWKRISDAAFDGLRTDVQCLHRWQKVLKPGLKKGQWTEEEDRIVREEVAKMGGAANVKWSAVAVHLPGRLGKQVRERWQNHLDPCLTKEPWAEEEDQLLISLQAVMGNRWSEIARAFEGRSENSVKNRWNSKQRKNLAMERKLRTGSELGLRTGNAHQDGDTQIRINFQKALLAAKTEQALATPSPMHAAASTVTIASPLPAVPTSRGAGGLKLSPMLLSPKPADEDMTGACDVLLGLMAH